MWEEIWIRAERTVTGAPWSVLKIAVVKDSGVGAAAAERE